MIEEANKFGAMPYATAAAFSQSNVTATAGDFTYTRRLLITAASIDSRSRSPSCRVRTRQWSTRSGSTNPSRLNHRLHGIADMKTIRAGYSLPEVLVATVLLGVIGGALTKM